MAADNQERDRKNLTFSQAEGIEPLPQPLKLGEISELTRSLLWREFHHSLSSSHYEGNVGSGWRVVLSDWHVEELCRPIDEFSPRLHTVAEKVKEVILKAPWNKVLDFLLFILRHRNCPTKFVRRINFCFEKSRAAYFVAPGPPTIMPRATAQEGAAIVGALKTLDSAGLGGARTHLLQAGERLNKGDYPDSVRESINAVESVARKLDPEAKGGLAPALKALERHAAIHGALRAGFSSIYGYTSDEDGIRHSMLEGGAAVDLEDAVFMLGACASFTSYLVGKARKVGLIAE
jgi:hypothetical protein